MNIDLQDIKAGFIRKDTSKLYSSLLSYIDKNRENIIFQIHPLGFKYFRLGKISEAEEFRLHFWINTNENQDDDLQIHDHSFDFESFVVYGGLKNTKYITKLNNNAKGYIYDVKFRNENSKLILNSNRQILEELGFEFITTGYFYYMEKNELHKSENLNEFTVSLLRILKPVNKIARVFSPKELRELPSFERSFMSEVNNLDLLNKLIETIKSGQNANLQL